MTQTNSHETSRCACDRCTCAPCRCGEGTSPQQKRDAAGCGCGPKCRCEGACRCAQGCRG